MKFERSRVSRVYGPYLYRTRNQTRRLVILVDDQGTRKTESYARFLMEEELGRELLPEEHVDHIDGDRLNDAIDNLQILSLVENNRKSTEPAPMHVFVCPQCGITACKPVREVKRNQATLGKAGPFCGKACAGRWSATQRVPK